MASMILSSLLAAGLMIGPAGNLPSPVYPVTRVQMMEPDDDATMAAPDESGPVRPRRQARQMEAGGSCAGAVSQATAMTGGEVLSVRPARNQALCVVTMLVTNAKGRPKKVRLRIPMDY
jgi:hypothetical protein